MKEENVNSCIKSIPSRAILNAVATVDQSRTAIRAKRYDFCSVFNKLYCFLFE